MLVYLCTICAEWLNVAETPVVYVVHD